MKMYNHKLVIVCTSLLPTATNNKNLLTVFLKNMFRAFHDQKEQDTDKPYIAQTELNTDITQAHAPDIRWSLILKKVKSCSL